MGNVRLNVIGRLQDLGFGPPSRVPVEKYSDFFNEYIDCLSGFDDAVLVKAMDEIRLNSKFWPTIAEVYVACRKHVPSEAFESANWGEEAKEKPTPEQQANVRRLAELARSTLKPPMTTAREELEGPPYAGIFDVNREQWEEKERRWSALERVDGQLNPDGLRRRDVEPSWHETGFYTAATKSAMNRKKA